MKVIVAGDYCPQDRVIENLEQEKYDSVLGEVAPYLKTADYSVVNLECPICYGGEKAILKHGPNLNCSEHGVKALKWAGFDCVTLANNHFLDFGRKGVSNTLLACEKYEIDTVGGALNLQEASRVLYKEIQGVKLAIINCCEHEFSIATRTTPGSNPLNIVHLYYSIQEAKKLSDYVLLIVHGGHEHFQLPSLRMVETYRYFIDLGIDAVVNHHQHCFSGFEVYNGKPIFYGLGNFCFDRMSDHSSKWTEGYMVRLNLDNHTVSFEIQPYIQCSEMASIRLLPRTAFDKKLKELNDIIKDSNRLETSIEDYYSRSSNAYGYIFEPLRNKYYIGAMRRGWLPSLVGDKRKVVASNYICCESHRDKLVYWFNKEKGI